ncbi:GNAT family protein [Vagococcus fluvialis]|uniref:GNAT family N-acetyltransferase n=1 Tax=Vagococcus fluvialis TaxID=2738 RepID=UPI00379E829C
MSELAITLREATPADAKELLAVMNILDKETPFLLVNQQSLKLDTESMAEQIDFIYEQDNQLILLAFNHNDLVGVATVMGELDLPLKHIGEIGISILKEYWGYGLGTVMLEEIIAWAKEAGVIKRLEIKVQERNTRALKLYEKVNFETEGIIRRGYLSEDNEYLDIVLMSYLV